MRKPVLLLTVYIILYYHYNHIQCINLCVMYCFGVSRKTDDNESELAYK